MTLLLHLQLVSISISSHGCDNWYQIFSRLLAKMLQTKPSKKIFQFLSGPSQTFRQMLSYKKYIKLCHLWAELQLCLIHYSDMTFSQVFNSHIPFLIFLARIYYLLSFLPHEINVAYADIISANLCDLPSHVYILII